MAIIIPSKSIYKINNPKIRDNVVNKVFIQETVVKPDNDYKVPVFNEDYQIENVATEENTLKDYQEATALNSGGSTIRYVRGACGLSYKIKHFTTPEILIPKIKDNKYVNKIYEGLDDEGNSEIKISVRATQKLYKGYTDYLPSQDIFGFANYNGLSLIEEKDLYDISNFETENDVTSAATSLTVSQPYSASSIHSIIIKDNELKAKSYLYANSNNNWSPAILNLNVAKTENIQLSTPSITEETIDGIEYYKLSSIKVFVGAEFYIASRLMEHTSSVSSVNGYISAPATRLILQGEQISITVYGNTIGISLANESQSYGEGNKPYNIIQNELIQDSAKVAEQNLGEYLANAVLRQYKNGKETATVRCSIGDYYDTENGLTITPKTDSKMTFDIGDKVVPMVRNSKGQDNVLSSYSNGTAKVFNVVGEKYIYDGAVWQELTLRETGEGLYIYVTENPYLTFSSETDFTLSVYEQNKWWNGVIEYSTNALDWAVWNAETISSVNGKLYLRGLGNTRIGMNTLNYNNWILNGTDIHCYGNIETLLDYKAVQNNIHPPMDAYCFGYLFAKNDSLKTPPSLPSTQLSRGCYYSMFSHCSNLTTLPLLPATSLAEGCYNYMFNYCSKIGISETQTSTYNKPYRIPVVGDGTATGDVAKGMFSMTTTNFGTPEINTTYYTSNELV